MQHFDSNPLHIVANLQHRLEQRAATDAQVWSTERMQPVTMARGVRIMGVRYCVHNWYTDWKTHVPQISNQLQVVVAMELFRSQYLEDKFSAIVLVGELLISDHVITPIHMPQFANLIDTSCISGYEVCDRFSQLVLKQLLIVHRHETMPIIAEWANSDNSWRARSAIWALIPLAKDAIYENLILDGCAIVLSKTEDCCKLAVGSALRALARTSPGPVYEFLNEDHNLLRMSAHGLSRACGDHNEWKQFFRNKRKDIVRNRRPVLPGADAVENSGAGALAASAASAPMDTDQMAVSLPATTEVRPPQATRGVGASESGLPSISELIGMRSTARGSTAGAVPVASLIHASGAQDEREAGETDEANNAATLANEEAGNGVANGEREDS